MSSQTSSLNVEFLEEYGSRDSIRRYSKETAGHGINYLLDHDYGKLYLEVVQKYLLSSGARKGMRFWEFGCGGGMNLIHFVSLMEQQGIPVEYACGTDFSDAQVATASREARRDLTPRQTAKARYCVARNENLLGDVVQALGVGEDNLVGSFDFMLGVNTLRYCYRLNKQNEGVKGIFDLLAAGGVCVVIDMNNRFPAFRSRFRDRLTKSQEALFLPSLDDYAGAFQAAGFEILRKEHFCWIPHSAGAAMTAVMRALTPVLSVLAPDRAMRSLVIARKPASCRS